MYLFISLAIPCMLIGAGMILNSGIVPKANPIPKVNPIPMVYEAHSINQEGIIVMQPKRKKIDYKV